MVEAIVARLFSDYSESVIWATNPVDYARLELEPPRLAWALGNEFVIRINTSQEFSVTRPAHTPAASAALRAIFAEQLIRYRNAFPRNSNIVVINNVRESVRRYS